MSQKTAYKEFIKRLTLLLSKYPELITTTLSNIFTMRLIGNKTHGDLAEIAIAEFINQYMYDFKSVHVGKDLYRAKQHEEDIKVINQIDNIEFPVSLKAYGDGPLQLSTDKKCLMFTRLEKEKAIIGDATANALQRGLWTHTKNGLKYFSSVTNGWISYSHNHVLVQLFSHALVASESGHKSALQNIKEDIESLKKKVNLK